MFEEPGNLLKQELRDAFTYNGILEVLAGGATKLSEIAGKMHMETSAVNYCMQVLISLGLVAKEVAITEEKNKRKTYYSIADSMFRFWFRFIPNGIDMIAAGDGEAYYEEGVKAYLSDYMGAVFENMSRNYLRAMNHKNKLPFRIFRIGRWWGNNKKRKERKKSISLQPTT